MRACELVLRHGCAWVRRARGYRASGAGSSGVDNVGIGLAKVHEAMMDLNRDVVVAHAGRIRLRAEDVRFVLVRERLGMVFQQEIDLRKTVKNRAQPWKVLATERLAAFEFSDVFLNDQQLERVCNYKLGQALPSVQKKSTGDVDVNKVKPDLEAAVLIQKVMSRGLRVQDAARARYLKALRKVPDPAFLLFDPVSAADLVRFLVCEILGYRAEMADAMVSAMEAARREFRE